MAKYLQLLDEKDRWEMTALSVGFVLMGLISLSGVLRYFSSTVQVLCQKGGQIYNSRHGYEFFKTQQIQHEEFCASR